MWDLARAFILSAFGFMPVSLQSVIITLLTIAIIILVLKVIALALDCIPFL